MTGALACQPVTARQLQWNWTPAGQVALQPCPIGANGLARWYCADTPAGPVWQGTSPDMSDCKSLAITTLEGKKKKSVDFKKNDPIVHILFPKVGKKCHSVWRKTLEH